MIDGGGRGGGISELRQAYITAGVGLCTSAGWGLMNGTGFEHVRGVYIERCGI